MKNEWIVVASGKKGKNSGKPYCILQKIVQLDDSGFIAEEKKFVEKYVPVGQKVQIEETII